MTDNPQTAPVAPGEILAGKYRVERVLGAGGMGVVVAARHLQLDERVALKFLAPAVIGSAEAVERFLREARAAVKIKNEHVARVLDVGQLENGSPYIVMEYLDGSDLAGLLRDRGSLPVQQAVDFVLQAAEALAEAHKLGIVHRDLKPANLFCTRRPDGHFAIKVLDFGISKVAEAGAGPELTKTATVVGTPTYMSPEQMIASKSVDARTDIWSLGAILFELVVGRPPFIASALTELAIRVASDPAPSARALRDEVPEALSMAIGTCLEKDRDRRFRTVGDLATALRPFASARGQASVAQILDMLRMPVTLAAPEGEPLPPDVASAMPSTPTTALSHSSTLLAPDEDLSRPDAPAAPRSPRRRLAIAALAVAGVAAVTGIGAIAARSPPSVPPAPTRSPEVAAATVAPGPATVSAPEQARDAGPEGQAEVRAAQTAAPGKPASNVRPAPRAVPSAAAAGARSAPNCNPNFTYDSEGNRIFKPECF